MTDRDEIELPPLPPLTKHAWLTDSQTVRDYARAAVIADRKRRAEQAKPKVHSKWIELFPDGDWKTAPGGASYHSTSTMLHICWTDDGRAWIESERNRELAEWTRDIATLPISPTNAGWLRGAADALDGGVR